MAALTWSVLLRGTFDIFVQKGEANLCVGKYDNKGSFGELALMYNTPRAATIVASQEGALWALVSPRGRRGRGRGRGRGRVLKAPSCLSLTGPGHVSQADRQKQRKEEEDVRGLHRVRRPPQVSRGSDIRHRRHLDRTVPPPPRCVIASCLFSLKLSERMKIVDVLAARTFKDGERIITQVTF